MQFHSRTRSTDNTTTFAAITGKTSRAAKRASRGISLDRRPSPPMMHRGNAAAASGIDPLDSIRHKAPFIGVVSTYGDYPRDTFLNALFNPDLRPPIPGQTRPYTSVTLQDRPWRYWVDQVVHPLAQPDHFIGQLAQLDVLVVLYSTQSASSFISVIKICERYLDAVPPYGSNSENTTSPAALSAVTPGYRNIGRGLPLPVIVATGSAPIKSLVVRDGHVPSSKGIALAAKYNGRFVELDSFTDACEVQRPIEAAVAAWAKGHTQVDLLLVPSTGSNRSENDGSPSESVPPSNSRRNTDTRDKRKNSSHTERRSKDSRSSLPTSVEHRGEASGTAAAPKTDVTPKSPTSIFRAPTESGDSADFQQRKKAGRMSRMFQALKRRVNSSTK
ncbi:hypothetical protein Cpir12675_003273 [Ceratocystis pirilliformis]|uniref:Uncharacterized protein n=1 Tax=Ceratocystis pirilliformis TaxID=259994 RepID=A0ABR3Z4X0_9PEZI